MEEQDPLVRATAMLCNTAIRIANVWIWHCVLRHNAAAGSGPKGFLNCPEKINEVEVP